MRRRLVATFVEFWEDATASLKPVAVDLWLQTKHWPSFQALPLARVLHHSWINTVRRHSARTGGPSRTTALTIRSVAVQSAVHNRWIFRTALFYIGAYSSIGLAILIPPLSASLSNTTLSLLTIAGIGVSAPALWALLNFFIGSISRIPPLSFIPLFGSFAGLGATTSAAWWIIRGDGSALLRASVERLDLTAVNKIQAAHTASTLVVAIALYATCNTLLDLWGQLTGFRSPGEILSRRFNGYPPPAHIGIESYLRLMSLIEQHRSEFRKRSTKRRIASSIRFQRGEIIAEVDRCIRSYGGSTSDRNLYRGRSEALSHRLKEHERGLFDALAPHEVDHILEEMTKDIESLCSKGWQKDSGNTRRSFWLRALGITRRLVPAVALGAFGLAYPRIPMVDPSEAGTGAVQAAIISAAIALLFTSEMPVEGRTTNIFARRGRDRNESDQPAG